MERSRFSRLVLILALVAVYYAAGRLGLSLAYVNSSVSAVWPPTGIALAAILLFGYRVWPGILLGAFLTNYRITPSIPIAGLIAIGNTLEAIIGAALTIRFANGAATFNRAADIVKFVCLVAPCSTAVSATVGVTTLCLGGWAAWHAFLPIWITWWLGDLISAFVVAPFILIWCTQRLPRYRPAQWMEAVLLILAVLVFGQYVFGRWASPQIDGYQLQFIGIPLLLWAAFRFSLHGAATVACVISAIAILATLHGIGPFATPDLNKSFLLLQAFMGIVTMTALILAAVLFEREGVDKQLKYAKDQAESANRAKDQFLALLSHELRTPLNPVLATVQLMKRDPQLSPDLRESAELIQRNVELETRLIDDLLDITRISQGKITLHPEPVDLHALLWQVVNMCAGDISARQLQLKMILDAAHHHAMGDAARLQQVFWNLLKNAVKFTPPGGTIALGTEQTAGGRIAITVQDSGAGIDPEVLPRIFNAFEQGGGEITRTFGGLGLGLAISKGLVGLHGGTLAAKSAGKGKGATFTIELIASSEAEAAHPSGAREPDRPVDRHSGRVLLVEDHVDTAKIMSRLLHGYGYDVRVAATVAAAQSAAAAEGFDLLLCDIGLPDGSGLDLMRELSAQYSIKGIALSGYGTEEDIQRSLAAGFIAHLTKPINLQTLEKTLHELSKPVVDSRHS